MEYYFNKLKNIEYRLMNKDYNIHFKKAQNMILEIFKNSLGYALKNKKILLKLGTLSILSFLILPLILILGYSYQIIEIGLKGLMDSFDPLPEMKNYKKMIIQGLKVLVIAIVYSIIPILILIATFINTRIIQTFTFVNLSNFNIHLDIGFIFIFLIAVLFLLSFLMTIVAIPHMIKNNSLKYAFKIKDLFKIIKYVGTKKYIEFYIIIIIFVLILPIITFILTQVIVSLIDGLVILTTGTHIVTLQIYYLNITTFTAILFFLTIPILTISLNRAVSFMYNDDGLKNQN